MIGIILHQVNKAVSCRREDNDETAELCLYTLELPMVLLALPHLLPAGSARAACFLWIRASSWYHSNLNGDERFQDLSCMLRCEAHAIHYLQSHGHVIEAWASSHVRCDRNRIATDVGFY